MGGKRYHALLIACTLTVASLTTNTVWANIPPPPQTPVPPDWKPFPDDASKASNSGAAQTKSSTTAQSSSNASSSAAVVATATVDPHAANSAPKELPTFWLGFLAALSAGLLVIGGHLIVREDDNNEFDESSEAAA